MSVHQLNDGRWFCQWRDRESKKLRRRYFGRSPDAEARAREFNESLDLRHYPRQDEEYEPLYFEKIAGAYLEAKEITLPETSYRVLYNRFMKTILPELGTISVYHLSPEHLDRYVRTRLRAGIRRSTVHTELTYVIAALNFAVEREAIQSNPVARYRKLKRDDRVIQPPTSAEVSAILAKAAPHLVRALSISYFTGLRPGQVELLTLRWDSIDWTAQTILITSAHKGGLQSRSVPIHPDLAAHLQTWRNADGINPFIIHFKGKPVRSLKTAFAHAKKKAGITRPLRMYSFRHAFATNALAAGADLKSVSELLGHSRPDTTLKIYQHTDLTLHRNTIIKLPTVEIPGLVIIDHTLKKESSEPTE